MTFKKVYEENWLEEAWRSYERAFGQKSLEGPVTFSQMEDLAVQEGNRLARLLLEKQLESEAAQQSKAAEACCTACGKPAPAKQTDPERRDIVARPGVVGVERQAYYCHPCRKTFFPSGPPARPAVRELQSLDSREGGVGGGQPGVVQEGQRGDEEIPGPRHQPEGAGKAHRKVRPREGKQKRR